MQSTLFRLQHLPWLALLHVLGLLTITAPVFGQEALSKEPLTNVKPIPSAIQQAWEKAGAKSGWIVFNHSDSRFADYRFTEVRENKGTLLPAFQFYDKKVPALEQLPDPGVPFGLVFSLRTRVSAAEMKVVATYPQLTHLKIHYEPNFDDDALRTVATSKSIETLMLHDTIITEKGLKHLNALPNLRALSLEQGGSRFVPKTTLTNESGLAGNKNLRWLRLEGLQIHDDAYTDIAKLAHLEEVFLAPKNWSNGIGSLGQLKKLKKLELSPRDQKYDRPSNEVCRGLSTATSLQTLVIRDTPLTAEGAKHLAKLTDLRYLLLGYPINAPGEQLTDAALEQLSKLSKLESLILLALCHHISYDGLKHLENLTELQELDMKYAELSNKGLAHLAKLKKLRALSIAKTPISADGLKQLSELKELESLDVRGCLALTSDGLEHLHGLKKLKELLISGTKMYGTPPRNKELAALQKATPGLKVLTNPDGYTDP